MRTEHISNNNFQGKAKLSKRLSKQEKIFAQKILDYEIDGMTNRKYLSKKNFDIDLLCRNTKKTVHPKLMAFSSINYILTRGRLRGQESSYVNKLQINIENGAEKGATELRAFIDATNDFIDKRLPTQFNNKLQLLGIKLKMLVHKI